MLVNWRVPIDGMVAIVCNCVLMETLGLANARKTPALVNDGER